MKQIMRCSIPLRITLWLGSLQTSFSADWPQFRGANGSGIAVVAKPPITWSETQNLKWKLELPGQGTSSPIVVGDGVFVTCWSGFGQAKQKVSTRGLQR